MAQTTIMPESVTEAAVKAFLTAQSISGLQLIARLDGTEEALPSLSIVCATADPDFTDVEAQTGNWLCRVALKLKSQKNDTTTAAHDTFLGQVLYALYTDTVVADLNSATAGDNFTAYRVQILGRRHWTDGEHRFSEQLIEVWMQPS